MDNKVVNLAGSSPQLVAKRIVNAGVYDEAALYMFAQDLYTKVSHKFGKEIAEMFADEFSQKSGLALACR